jgi:hypothetical protein
LQKSKIHILLADFCGTNFFFSKWQYWPQGWRKAEQQQLFFLSFLFCGRRKRKKLFRLVFIFILLMIASIGVAFFCRYPSCRQSNCRGEYGWHDILPTLTWPNLTLRNLTLRNLTLPN